MQRFMGDFTTGHFLLDMWAAPNATATYETEFFGVKTREESRVPPCMLDGESRDISEPEAYALVAALRVGGDTPYWERPAGE